MKKTLAALAIGAVALSAPAFAQTQGDLPPTLQGTGLTPEIAAATAAAVVFIGIIIADDDDPTSPTTTTTTTTTSTTGTQ